MRGFRILSLLPLLLTAALMPSCTDSTPREEKTMSDGVQARVPRTSLKASNPQLISHLQFSPDGKWLAVDDGIDPIVRLWDPRTFKLVYQLQHPNPVRAIRFSSDSELLLTGGEEGRIRLWNLGTGGLSTTLPVAKEVERGKCLGLAVSPDGTTLVSCNGKLVIVWELASKKSIDLIMDGEDIVRDLAKYAAFSPDSRRFVVTTIRRNLVYDANTKKVLGACLTANSSPSSPEGLAYAPDGKSFATAEDTGTVRLWDANSFSEVWSVPAFKENAVAVCYSPGGKFLIAAGQDRVKGPGYVCIWELASKKQVSSFFVQHREVLTIAISQDGRWLASGGQDREVNLYDISDMVGGTLAAPK